MVDFYHLKIVRNDNRRLYEWNRFKNDVDNIVRRYNSEEQFHFSGTELSKKESDSFSIYHTFERINNKSPSTLAKRGKDVTIKFNVYTSDHLADQNKPALNEVNKVKKTKPKGPVFIVHGREEDSKDELSRHLAGMRIESRILQDQADRGMTIFQKLRHYSSDIGYAIVLLTPDDVGDLKKNKQRQLRPRARQNVILELGYFMSKLGPRRVCCLIKEGVEAPLEQPTDVLGIIMHKYKRKVKERLPEIMKNLGDAGYKVA